MHPIIISSYIFKIISDKIINKMVKWLTTIIAVDYIVGNIACLVSTAFEVGNAGTVRAKAFLFFYL